MTANKKPKPSIDFGYPTPADGPVPAFNSIEEEAEFWDTHDTTDFHKLEPWELNEGFGTEDSLTLVLTTSDRDELDRRAREMGVEPAALVRKWVEEHLRREAS
jgi:hypothetical protein